MSERRIKVQRHMEAPTRAVWAVFADFPHLAAHWGGLRASHAVGTRTSGVGARRVPRGGPLVRFTGPLLDRMLTSTFADMLGAVDAAALAEHDEG